MLFCCYIHNTFYEKEELPTRGLHSVKVLLTSTFLRSIQHNVRFCLNTMYNPGFYHVTINLFVLRAKMNTVNTRCHIDAMKINEE